MTGKSLTKHFLLPALLLLLLVVLPSTAGASERQETIKSELIQLQFILQRQEQLILAQQQELQNLKAYTIALEQTLQQAESKLTLSKEELAALKEDLQKSSVLIEKANQELEKLSADWKKQITKVKMQRNVWFTGFAITSIALLAS